MASQRMSFPEIVRVYQQPLYWYIRKVVLVHEDAEDILQETFVRAYRYLWTLRDDGAMKPWLYRIATNEINRYFKRHKAEVNIEEVGLQVASEAVSQGQVGEVISSSLLKMTPLQRQVFCLKYYDELDYDQISRITGSNKNTLMVSYHGARKIIEKEIDR